MLRTLLNQRKHCLELQSDAKSHLGKIQQTIIKEIGYLGFEVVWIATTS